jgi:hypothetical protein
MPPPTDNHTTFPGELPLWQKLARKGGILTHRGRGYGFVSGDKARQVADGAVFVRGSGQNLEQIVASVKKVSDIVAEIAAASREQSLGIAQVNRAVPRPQLPSRPTPSGKNSDLRVIGQG